MIHDESKLRIEEDVDGKIRKCVWMDSDIELMLDRIGNWIGSGCIIDAGSFCIIVKSPWESLELQYTYKLFNW